MWNIEAIIPRYANEGPNSHVEGSLIQPARSTNPRCHGECCSPGDQRREAGKLAIRVRSTLQTKQPKPKTGWKILKESGGKSSKRAHALSMNHIFYTQLPLS